MCHHGNANSNDEVPPHKYKNDHNPEHCQHQMLAKFGTAETQILIGIQHGMATFKTNGTIY